jgi:predicted RNase H-like nuclease
LIEVYPHVSLLAISRYGDPNERPYPANLRLPYKASKTRQYWPTITAADMRRQRLIAVWNDILVRLAQSADVSAFALPADIEDRSFAALKPYEDQIDALVCAWTAARFVEGALIPLGDNTSAIWVPKELI